VSGTDTLAQHWGTLYTMADYKTQSHNVFVTANLFATDQLNFMGTLAYNMSKGEYDPVAMPDPAAEVTADLSHQDFTFDEMHEYSMLDYKYLQVSFGLEYTIRPGYTFTADVDYADFTDDGFYVFGDESGSMLMVRSGVRLTF